MRALAIAAAACDANSTAPGASPIRVAAAREDAQVAVSVCDEGPGVAPERLPNLFRRHPGGGEGATAGHGLGLAICKGLVEAHGGRIRAESAGPGCGTTFTFTVPVAGEPTAAAAGHAAGPPPAADRDGPPRVLVVDDDPRMLRFVRDALSEAGYAPLVLGAPEDLARIIRTERPHLVLLDLVLPDVDGIELMQQVPELSDLPVIFISAYRRDDTVAQALEAGAADYIAKPFSPTELVARVRAALRRRAAPEPFVLGALAIDYAERRVTVGGEAVELTATEYELLRVLSLEAGRVVTFDTLLRRVWAKREKADANLVRSFVRDLRRKLGDSADSPPTSSASAASATAWRGRPAAEDAACRRLPRLDSPRRRPTPPAASVRTTPPSPRCTALRPVRPRWATLRWAVGPRCGWARGRSSCGTSPIRDSDACSASRRAIRTQSLATINRRAVRSRVTSSAASRADGAKSAAHRPSYRSGVENNDLPPRLVCLLARRSAPGRATCRSDRPPGRASRALREQEYQRGRRRGRACPERGSARGRRAVPRR